MENLALMQSEPEEPYENLIEFLRRQVDYDIAVCTGVCNSTVQSASGGEAAKHGLPAKRYFSTFDRQYTLSHLYMLRSVIDFLSGIDPTEDAFLKVDDLLLRLAYPYRHRPGFNSRWT